MKRRPPRGIFERKPGEYWIRYADQYGRIHREKIGTSLKLAQAAYQKRKTEIREGKFFPKKASKRNLLFPAIAIEFLEFSRKTKRSYSHDKARMETLFRLWRDCSLEELTPGKIENDLAICSEQESWTPATFNRYRALTSAVFSLAIRNARATVNPVRGTRHRIENNTRVRYLGADEEKRMVDFLRYNEPDRVRDVIVALHSGMRRSEQYATRSCPEGGLKWNHIDFQANMITLPRSKHGESRHIPMNSLLRETLREIFKDTKSIYVFPGQPPDDWFPKVCAKTNLKNFSWHCMRHTFASRLVMAGVDLRTVQELLGHKTIITTMRYAHLAPGHQAVAVEKLVAQTSTSTSTKLPEIPVERLSEIESTSLESGARGRNRTGTDVTVRGILSPAKGGK